MSQNKKLLSIREKIDSKTIWYSLKEDGLGQYEILQNKEERDVSTMKGVISRMMALKLITCREEILCESIEEN